MDAAGRTAVPHRVRHRWRVDYLELGELACPEAGDQSPHSDECPGPGRTTATTWRLSDSFMANGIKRSRPIRREFSVRVVSQVFGRELSALIRRHRIIIGPRYPSAPGYWSDRIYVVLGHGGFFLAPEIEGMREEGFVPGVHYAALGDDVIRDIRYWLARPEERARIAREGQELVLSKFTYEHRVRTLCAAIAGG